MNRSLDGSMEESWTEGDGNMREFDLREILVSLLPKVKWKRFTHLE